MSEDHTIDPLVVEMTGSELPDSILARLPERPRPDARFSVTIEPVLTPEERLDALRREIDAGLESDQIIPAETVFAELRKRFPAA